MKLEVKVVKVTKKLIDSLLAKNERNRSINKNEVNHILRDIKADRWMFNGDVIKIDGNGYLMDGQHRLMAIKEAGYPSDMQLIIVKLPVVGEERDKVFYTMNTSRASSAGQIFQYNEIPNALAKTTISRWIAKIYFNIGICGKPSYGEIFEVYKKFVNEVDTAVSLSHNHKGVVRFLAPMAAAFAIAAYARQNDDKVWEFAKNVSNGTGLRRNTVEYALFKYCSMLKTGHIGTMAQKEQFYTALNAVYTYLDCPDKPITRIRPKEQMREKLYKRALADAQSK